VKFISEIRSYKSAKIIPKRLHIFSNLKIQISEKISKPLYLTLYLDAMVAIDVATLEIHSMHCSSSYHIFHNNKRS